MPYVFDGCGHSYYTGEHMKDLRAQIRAGKHHDWRRESVVSALTTLQDEAKIAPPGNYKVEIESLERWLEVDNQSGSPLSG